MDHIASSRGFDNAVAFPTGLVRYAREQHGDDRTTDVFAVGLPATALQPLLVSLAATSCLGTVAVGADALRPQGVPLGNPIRVRVLGRSETLAAALDDANVASAAGFLYRDFLELQTADADEPAEAPAGDGPSAATPEEAQSTPQAATIRSTTRAGADDRPVDMENIRVAPTDRSGRVLGSLAAVPGDAGTLDRSTDEPGRPLTAPALLFVDDVAFAVVPGVSPPEESDDGPPRAFGKTFDDLSDRSLDFPSGNWAAVPVAEGEAARHLRSQYETGWAECDPVTVATPPLDTVFSAVEETLGTDYARAFVVALGSATVTVEGVQDVTPREASTMGDRPVLESKHLVVLVGASVGAKRKDIASAMDGCGFVSSTTMQRGLEELQRAGLVTTEAIETGTRGRNPHRLVLAESSLQEASLPDMLAAAASRLAE